jgi:hypothetical protein
MEHKIVTIVDENNPDLGDVYVDAAGQTVLLTSLTDEVAQRLWVRFRFFKGEWFLNLNAGTPWFGDILTRAPSDQIIRAVLTSVIKGTEGVESVRRLEYSISPQRRLTVDFEAVLKDASTFSTTTYGPFEVVL